MKAFLRVAPPPLPSARVNLSDKTGIVDLGEDGVLNVGDAVVYTFEVSNTGQTCLSAMSILDDNVGSVECPDLDMPGKQLRRGHTKRIRQSNRLNIIEIRYIALLPCDPYRNEGRLAPVTAIYLQSGRGFNLRRVVYHFSLRRF